MMRNFVKRNKIFDNNFAFCEQDQRKKKGELVFFFLWTEREKLFTETNAIKVSLKRSVII